MAGGKSSPLNAKGLAARFVQFDLFDTLSDTLIEIAPQAELPPVLARHPHGVQLGAHFVTYQLQRSTRRSIGFQITREGLQITAPRWVSLTEIHSAVESKQRWILKHLQAMRDQAPEIAPRPTLWGEGATLPYMGQTATIRLAYGRLAHFDPESGCLTLNLPPEATPELCRKHLSAWLMREARRYFAERMPVYAERLGVRYHSISLSSAGTRWGSCNSQGKIRLNWRLIHFAPQLIDYVIAHELAHLHEMNHSARFWARVRSVCPDYETLREQLNLLGRTGLPDLQ